MIPLGQGVSIRLVFPVASTLDFTVHPSSHSVNVSSTYRVPGPGLGTDRDQTVAPQRVMEIDQIVRTGFR